MRLAIVVLAAAWCAVAVAPASAQADARPAQRLQQRPANSNVAVRLRDGSILYGRLERQGGDSLVIVGAAGRVAIATVNIADVRNAGDAHESSDGSIEFWFPNANSTRLFFGPTGRTLPQGEGYFADHYLVLGSLSVGLTDRLQLGVGSFLIPNSNFWFVLPKIGIVRGEQFNLAAGAMYGGVRELSGGIGYLVGTWGSADRNVTAGVGQGLSGSKVSGKPLGMLGGEWRVSRRVALVSENYFGAGSDEGLLSYGMRFLGEKMSVDIAFLNSTRHAEFPGFVYVDFVIKW